MGTITGAAIGALLIGLAEQFGLAYFPTYGIVLTFVIMVAVLAFRPQGIMGQARMSAIAEAASTGAGAAAARAARPSSGRSRARIIGWRSRCWSLYPLVATPILHLSRSAAIR